MSAPNKFTLTSSDGENFEVDEAVAREFEIVAHMIDDGCTGSNIPITTVEGKILAKVIEYCKKHVEVGNVEGNKEELKKWDEEFIKVGQDTNLDTVFALIQAANYLNVKGLLDIGCQKIADTIKDKQPEEIRKIFSIKNDFTPEEEADLRNQNEWAYQP